MGFYKLFILLFVCFNVLNADKLKKVNLQLSWFDQFQFAGYYIAKEKGFYRDAGLDVEIKPFAFGIDIPHEVSIGNIDFAVGRETLILDKSKNKDIVALYALFQSTPLVLLSTKESNISRVNDFINKNIMTTIDDASEVSLKAMIRSHNVKIEDLNFKKHTHNIDDLLNKNTDVISAYISKSPYTLKTKGIEYNIFDPKDYGFDMYSDFLYTNSSLVKYDHETVEAFKEASLKGWEYAYSNIEETSNLILKEYNSQKLTKNELLYEGSALRKLSYFNTRNLGEIKKEKLQRIFDLYNIMGLVKNKIDLETFVYSTKIDSKIEFTKAQKEYLKEKKEIRICAIPNAIPHSYIRNGKLEGFAKDFVKLLEENTHINFKLVETYNWAESLNLIKNKDCDILPTVSKTNERKKYLNFTDSYTQIPVVLISKNDSPFIDSLLGLKDVKIGITEGFSLYDELVSKYKNIKFVKVSSTQDGLEKIKDEKLYGHITSMGSAWYLLQKSLHKNLKISGKIDEKLAFRVGIRNDDLYLYEILTKVVNLIDKDEITRIENKWAYIEYEKEFDLTLLIQIIVAVSFIILFLLYRQNLLKNMNKKLNKKVDVKTKELLEVNHTLEDRIKKEVEENLKKDRILAQQTKMASMGGMLENIAHQWRQPLSVISTGASGLKIKKELNDLDDELLINTLDTIISSSKYLSHTIDDFRYFFKPNKEKSEFSIDHCIEKTTNLLSSKFDNKNINIIQNMQKVIIEGFETELIQVFINILNNSADALEISDVNEKLIFIDIKKIDNKSMIKITDNAGGINIKIINKIFEPYFTTKHQKQGTGIGLYMCDQIISKYMNGSIEVCNSKYLYNDKEYVGAEFLITLYDE